jgi:hypothetical protein
MPSVEKVWWFLLGLIGLFLLLILIPQEQPLPNSGVTIISDTHYQPKALQ